MQPIELCMRPKMTFCHFMKNRKIWGGNKKNMIEKNETVQGTIRMPKSMYDILVRTAEKQGISFNALICIILMNYLNLK